jgi:hypothetical protein
LGFLKFHKFLIKVINILKLVIEKFNRKEKLIKRINLNGKLKKI